VFVDVEGYEAHALAGAQNTIAEAQTDFFVELHDAAALAAAGSTADDVLGHFAGRAYDVSIAIAEESAAAVSKNAALVWQDAGCMLHRQGRRSFVIARTQ
jgi:hypothetical protein